MKLKNTGHGFALLCILALAGCHADYGNLPPLPASENASEIDPDKVTLAAGDTVNVTVYQDETLSGPRIVDAKGNITMPMAGNIEAAGLTKEALQEKIAQTFVEKGLLRSPQITVDVATSRPFYIIGEVKNPGSYPYQPTLDVFKAIALAGGYTPRADENNVVISRNMKGEKKRYRATEDSPILPGDSIMVVQRFF